MIIDHLAIIRLAGSKQQELAEVLGITQSSVSARQRLNGPAALARSYAGLGEGLGVK